MNNIIPKIIKRTKFEFYKGFGLVEILVLSSWIVLAALFIFGLPIDRYWKILAMFITSMIAISLILPVMAVLKIDMPLYYPLNILLSQKNIILKT